MLCLLWGRESHVAKSPCAEDEMKWDQMLATQLHAPHFQCLVAAWAWLVLDAEEVGHPITKSLLGHYCSRVSQVRCCSLCERRPRGLSSRGPDALPRHKTVAAEASSAGLTGSGHSGSALLTPLSMPASASSAR